MKKVLFAAIASLIGAVCLTGCDKEPKAVSPDGKNEISLYANPLSYEVKRNGKVVLAKTEISLKMAELSCNEAQIVNVKKKNVSGKVNTPVYKKASVDLSAQETFVDFGDFGVRLIARKDGVAYRFEVKKGGIVDWENANLCIPLTATRAWYNMTQLCGAEETIPTFNDVKNIKTDGRSMIYAPFVFAVDGTIVAVTESNVHDYPVIYFKKSAIVEGQSTYNFESTFSKYPNKFQRAGGGETKDKGGRWVRVTGTENYIAKVADNAVLPWRTFILADSPEKLCENDIVFALANPQAKGSDFSWVKPGKVAWDWWNYFDNGKGCNTATYKRFIDFATKNNVEYVILDEGWSETLNIWKFHKDVDVPEIIRYGNEKGVGIILWMAWAQAYGDEAKVAEHFAKLGAKGFKVDFMDRGDAQIAVFLEKFADECAKNKMLVDYHGVYRPVGLHRTYPNIINYEGVHGLEHMKWAPKEKDMAYNDVACFFIRMTAGPMDYTPGAMKNWKIGDYQRTQEMPGSVGTRVHQMALMALYEAPLQMLSDSPTLYEKNMECFSFMSKTPVVWDDTIGLPGCPESVAAVARKAKCGAWFVAGITNKDAREYKFSTAFLGDGEWKAEIFRDADNSNDEPEKYVHENKVVKAGETLTLKMANGGGFIVKFTK